MNHEAAELLQHALELPAEARAALADSLLESLETEVDADAEQAWRNEIESRLLALRSGESTLVPWDEVKTRLIRRPQR